MRQLALKRTVHYTMELPWRLLAHVLARPRVCDWLIRRALQYPFVEQQDRHAPNVRRQLLFNLGPAAHARRGWCARLPVARLHWVEGAGLEAYSLEHAGAARGILLRGWYQDERVTGARRPGGPVSNILYVRKAGDTMIFGAGRQHRIRQISPGGALTLYLSWERQSGIGFLADADAAALGAGHADAPQVREAAEAALLANGALPALFDAPRNEQSHHDACAPG